MYDQLLFTVYSCNRVDLNIIKTKDYLKKKDCQLW